MSGKNYGYAYVIFTKKKDAHDAIDAMDGHKIKGKVINVSFVEDDDEEEASNTI